MRKIKNKTNNWKTATIILGIILIGLIVYDYYSYYRFGDIKISKDDLNGFTDMAMKQGKDKFGLCEIETGKCLTINIGEGK